MASAAKKVRKPVDSEVHSYGFIKDNLRDLGWDVRNPSRNPAGQVYTQNECLTHDEIKQCLGLEKPENVVKITESIFWIIEAKPTHAQLEQAIKEAEEYARKVNKSKNVQALFVSGVAGNPVDSYLMQTRFLVGNQFRPITINGKEVSALISPQIAKTVLDNKSHIIQDVPIDEALFLSKAEKINEILHLGAINKNYRARVMAALLLAMIEDTPPNIDTKPSILISEINARARHILTSQDKRDFLKYIEIALPPTEDNHLKFKAALVQTIQELNNLNIRSAMNSGADVLGKFYEVFLKYGNGAKEIGIVLTPRHITKFIVEVLGITDRDVVYDPTCGTAGFLVAVFDYIRLNYSKAQVNRFKVKNLFGVEQEAEVVALAIVNMIFRGDGKTNIIEGNCFQKNLVKTRDNGVVYSPTTPDDDELAVTKVTMNPPFALKASDEKEYRFINQALKQMQHGSVLFSVLPYPAMVRPGSYLTWRKDSLLRHNTLLAVITFPPDLFYPVNVHTVGIFVRKGIPHPQDQNVLWIRAHNDGMLKRKGVRLPNAKATDDYAKIKDTVRSFLVSPTMAVPSIDRFQKACPVDFADPALELVPEYYLDERPPTEAEIRAGIERVIRDTAAFLIQERKENEVELNGKKNRQSVSSEVGRLPFDE